MADRWLELARGHDHAGLEARRDVGVDDRAPAAAEIRGEAEVIDAAEGAFHGRTNAAQQESVRGLGRRVATERAVVGEQCAAQANEIRAIRGADLETRRAGDDFRRTGRGRLGRFIGQFEFALENGQALFLLFEFAAQVRVRAGVRAAGRVLCECRPGKRQQRRDGCERCRASDFHSRSPGSGGCRWNAQRPGERRNRGVMPSVDPR
jgi:hypothetical protein